MIFLDNAGTTKMFDECAGIYKYYACEKFYNPSAMSRESSLLHQLLDDTRKFFLKKLGATSGTVIFTGGATESNNLAIRGSVRNGNFEYLFSSGEHPSVYNVAKSLQNEGKAVNFIKLTSVGTVNIDDLRLKLNANVRLISIMLVSNETGAINDIKKITLLRDELCPKALLHVDAVQGFMKIPFSLQGVDLLTFSAHKFHGPKGVGGLYVKNSTILKNIVYGGGQEFGLRSGTENVAGIMAMRKACELIDVRENFEKVSHLKEVFNQNLNCEGIQILNFGGSPYIESLVFNGVKGETMLHALEERGVIVGLGSACSSKKAGNRILQEIGIPNTDIVSSVRVSFNAYMSEKEIFDASQIIVEVYNDIKRRVN